MKVTAIAQPSGRWWAVEIPDLNDGGIFTQARHLQEVPAMAAEAVALILQIDQAQIDVQVQVQLPPSARAHLDAAERLRAQAAAAQHAAAEEARAAARALRETGLPLREVGAALGVSYQRAHQLLSA
jgi:hypothetical protein